MQNMEIVIREYLVKKTIQEENHTEPTTFHISSR